LVDKNSDLFLNVKRIIMSNLIGRTLLNQFHVDAFVASGGMGAVYLVTDLKRNAPLAMKVLHADLADDPTVFKRFQREAQALRQLKHPNIVPFYGLYQDRGATFLLEAFISGSSLQEILRENHKLPVNEALVYMKGLCAALGYAHSLNIVHCDVKPGNVMVDHKGGIYLTDFGIARFVGATTTTTMGVAGTPAYMAPEQIVGRGIGPATDIYALGVMLYEMLTGQKPFRGTEPETEAGGATPSERIRYGHLHVPPPDPRQVNPAINPKMSQVMLKALAKNPAERFRSTQDFFAALCWAVQTRLEDVSGEATILGDVNVAPSGPGPHTSATPQLSGTEPKRRNFVPIFAAAGLALVLVLCMAIAGYIGYTTVIHPTAIVEPSTVLAQPDTPTAVLMVIPTMTVPSTPTEIQILMPASATPYPDEIVDAYGVSMRLVSAGPFTMGSKSGEIDEGPVHVVDLPAYYMDKYEVTNAFYKKCVDAGVCQPPQLDSETRSRYYGNPEFDDYPVIVVKWASAKTYCEWRGARLPTETEWEKAARGTDGRNYPWGEGIDCGHANYLGKACIGDTTRVGSYESGKSPYGMYDMAGNVWEWVADWYDVYPGGDPSRYDTYGQKYRVVRGGSWGSSTDAGVSVLRVSYRGWPDPSFPYGSIGFRCGRSQ
jgi:serine/threonine-protein kinase